MLNTANLQNRKNENLKKSTPVVTIKKRKIIPPRNANLSSELESAMTWGMKRRYSKTPVTSSGKKSQPNALLKIVVQYFLEGINGTPSFPSRFPSFTLLKPILLAMDDSDLIMFLSNHPKYHRHSEEIFENKFEETFGDTENEREFGETWKEAYERCSAAPSRYGPSREPVYTDARPSKSYTAHPEPLGYRNLANGTLMQLRMKYFNMYVKTKNDERIELDTMRIRKIFKAPLLKTSRHDCAVYGRLFDGAPADLGKNTTESSDKDDED